MKTIDCHEVAKEIVAKMSVAQKAKLLSQVVWETTDVHQIHPELEKFLLADGPAGIRRLKEYFDEDIYNTKPSTCYPSPSTYASSWNRELLYELGAHIGIEARQEDVDTMLAPAVNIKRSPLGGRNFEYYSEDPFVTSELATEFILGMQEEGVGACLKHFAVNNQETRRMNINVRVDEEALQEVYLSAFEKPVKVGKPKMVMTAYNKVNGEFCASNEHLLSTLRNEWNYQGVVVTDCFAAHDLGKGIEYGLTLQMPGETGPKITGRIEELLLNHELTEDELDQAVIKNITFALEAMKERAAHDPQQKTYDREEHHRFAQQVAEESIVLLKNEGVLPLLETEKLLVVGKLAKTPRFQGGGSSHVNPYNLEIPIDEIQKQNTTVDYLQGYQLDGTEDPSLFDAVLSCAAEYEKVVVYAGLPDLIESEGYDRKTIQLPTVQNKLIQELTKIHKQVIVVLANGSVVEMPWKENVQAILEGYLGGEASGTAQANILFGKVNPSGKLAETFPIHLEDNPSYLYFPGNEDEVSYGEGEFVGYKHYEALGKAVLFPFGHGLSYTIFEYANIHIQADARNQTVVLNVKNTGNRSGKEVVQVYVQKQSVDQSICPKKLVGFEKITLDVHEDKTVAIELDPRTFMNYSVANGQWEISNGEYKIFVGSSVADIRDTQTIKIENQPILIHEDSTIGDMIKVQGMYEKLESAFRKHPASLKFLELTKDEDPLKALSMGSLMTLNTLKRVDETLNDVDILSIIAKINNN
ncbi:MAG: beta-glucosidase [Enterococcus sp.]